MTYADQLRKNAADFADVAAACTTCVDTLQKINAAHGLAKGFSPIEIQLLGLAETFMRLAAQPVPSWMENLPVAGSA